VPQGGSVATWPALGTHDGLPAFIVRQRRRALVSGLVFSLVLTVVAFGLALAAKALGAVVVGLFFAYLTWINARSLRRGAALFLTSRGMSLTDGGGQLSALWGDVEVRLKVRRRGVVALHVDVPDGLLHASGGARTWKQVNRALGTQSFVLHPARYEQGVRLAKLLEWCDMRENHQVIGLDVGRRRFHESCSSDDI
jgi:hypothetical protein